MDRNILNYGQCWEDPEVLMKALNINANDVVLSVTSGGDNTLALLLCNPHKITSIDLNQAQNYLLELKLVASRVLSYDNYLSFLGVTDVSTRFKFLTEIMPHLSSEARTWWSKNDSIIKKGVINNGRFERFLNLFRKYLLPLVHSRKTVYEFINVLEMKDQREFYKSRWSTKRWRMYFRMATSSYILRYLARQRGMFKYVKMKLVSDEYLKRLESNLYSVPIVNNYFLYYCLTGSFGKSLPVYLQEKNYKVLRKNKTTKLSIVASDILSHLKSMPDNYYTKFNLSDIFEALSKEEIELFWEEIIRTSKKSATVVYWDNLLQNPVPSRFTDVVVAEEQLQKKLFQEDRVFFYGSFYVYKVIK